MRLLKVVAVAMSLVALTAIAQESGTVVATARHAEHGVHLVDGVKGHLDSRSWGTSSFPRVTRLIAWLPELRVLGA